MRGGERADAGGIGFRQAQIGRAVMETVAEGEDGFGLQSGREALDHGKGRAGVIGRQHLAAGSIGAAFLQVQVRHHKQAPGRPPQRPFRQRRQQLTRNVQEGGGGLRGKGGHVGGESRASRAQNQSP
ncbi:MAG: hypothetical protein R3C04_09900 [Hyphomonas sp.]